MLSYFLGGGDSNFSSSAPPADYASTSTSSLAAAGDDQGDDSLNSSWQHLPPPTPAVQFYSHTPSSSSHSPSHRGQRPRSGDSPLQQQPRLTTSRSQSSSSSSLSSMAAALVSGVGPGMLYQQLHLQRVAAGGGNIMPSTGYGGESPLSPAAMFGLEHENLLLPPAPTESSSSPRTNAATGTGNECFMGPPERRQPTSFAWPQPGTGSTVDNTMPPPPPHSMMAPMFPQPSNPNLSVGQSMMHMLPSHHPLHHQQFMYTAAAVHAASLQRSSAPEEESEEKRAKRLERNRESARKCRRRKKERLATLGAQVNRLHHHIEGGRAKLINAMVPAIMQACRRSEIKELFVLENLRAATPVHVQDKLLEIVRGSGPSSELMRSVLEFQYRMLKELTLPYYQKMVLWLTLRDEAFFMAGKEHYTAKQQRKENGEDIAAPGRPATGKISSKQIGEELTNGGNSNKKREKKSDRRGGEKDSGGSDGEGKAITSSPAYDAARFWPLFCFELKFSVDQEERFVAAHKQITEGGCGRNDLSDKRSQMAAAVVTTDSLAKAVGSLSHIIARREERTLLGILSPRQVASYQAWLTRDDNRGKGRREVVGHRHEYLGEQFTDALSASDGNTGNSKEGSLHDISRRLSEVLWISSKSDTVMLEK